VEPIQGEGGYVVPPTEFLLGMHELCDDHEILLRGTNGFSATVANIGLMRRWLARPTMAVSKGIVSGSAGSHGTTFGGNPVSCATALATLKVFAEEQVLQNCREQGERLRRTLELMKDRHRIIGDVRGVGLMIGVELVITGTRLPNPSATRAVLESA